MPRAPRDSGVGLRNAHLFCGALCLMQVSPGAHLKNTPVENIPISILSVLSKNVCFVLESIIS